MRDDLHDIAERTVKPLTDAHEYLERDELVFRELGERVGADADLAGEFGLVPAFVDELLEKAIVGNKHSRYLLLLFFYIIVGYRSKASKNLQMQTFCGRKYNKIAKVYKD